MKCVTVLFMVSLMFLSSCKDKSIIESTDAPESKPKSSVSNDYLPENDFQAAIKNHGIKQLLAWAEDGDKKAQLFIALAYIDGTTIPKNFNASEKWALRSANQGVPAAQYFLGLLKQDSVLGENILLIEPNIIYAYMWFSLAAAQGHRLANQARDKIQATMEPGWIDRAQTLAGAWQVCNKRECSDLEPDTGPPSSCKDYPNSISCLAGNPYKYRAR